MGELTPGTPLRLEDLARQLGMSISPIREAVRQLEALGLAEHVPHHGAKVMRARRGGAARALLGPARARGDGRAPRGGALRPRPTPSAARAHLTAYDEARHRGDIRAAVRAHGSFHFAVYEAARSSWLAAADPPRVGLLRAVPARAARGGRRCRTGTRARRRAARGVRRARRRRARAARCTTTSSLRATSTRSSSRAARSSRSSARERRGAVRGALRGGGFSSSARRACPSRRRGPGRAMCSRRCARAGRPASRGPGCAGTAARGSSGRARARRRTGRRAARLTFIRSRSAGDSTTRCSRLDSRFGMRRASRAWMRFA